MPPTTTREQIAAAEIAGVFDRDKYRPEILKDIVQKLKEANKFLPRPEAISIEGKLYSLPEAQERLAEFIYRLPAGAQPKIVDESFYDQDFLINLENLIDKVAGLAQVEAPAANIPVNLNGLVEEFLKGHENSVQSQLTDLSPEEASAKRYAARAEQIKILAQFNQVKIAAVEQLTWALDNSDHLNNIAAIWGISPSQVKVLARQRAEQIVDQAITMQAFRQARGDITDPTILSKRFVDSLKGSLSLDDLVGPALKDRPAKEAGKPRQPEYGQTALKNIEESVKAETIAAEPEIKAVQKDVSLHPLNRPVALKLAQTTILQAESATLGKPSLKDSQQQRLVVELGKHHDNPTQIAKILKRVYPKATSAQIATISQLVGPAIGNFAASSAIPNFLALANPQSILVEANLHPQWFPKSFVQAVQSGKISTPQDISAILTISRNLNIPVDAVILHYFGIDPLLQAKHLTQGKGFLGLPTQKKLPTDHPLVKRLTGLAEPVAKLDVAVKNHKLAPGLEQQYKQAALPFRRSARIENFIDRINPFRFLRLSRFSLSQLPPVPGISSSSGSFFSGLRVRSAPVNSFVNGIESIGRGFGQLPRIFTAPFRAVGNWASNRIIEPVKSWAGTKIKSGLAKLGAWAAKKGLTKAAEKIGQSILGKATLALLGQAIPIVGPAIAVLGALSIGKDILGFLWQNKEGIGKLALGALVTGQLLLKSLIGAIGSAAWTLGGSILGGLTGFFLGAPAGTASAVAGAALGAGVGGVTGAWIGAGGLTSALAGAGTALGSAAAGIGSFIGAITAPSALIATGTTVASVAVVGTLTLGFVLTKMNQNAQSAALFVPSGIGGISGWNYLPGCPAEMWPVDLLKGQTYYIAQGPGGWATHGPSLPNQEPNCPTDRDPERRCSYVEAIDIAPPTGTVTVDNVIIASHPGTVIKAAVDGYGGNYVQVQDNCGANFISVYVHMSAVSVLEGQPINTGDPIGIMGSTGRSSGPHLHYEFRNPNGSYKTRQDPPPFMIQPFIPKTVPEGCVQNCNVSLP